MCHEPSLSGICPRTFALRLTWYGSTALWQKESSTHNCPVTVCIPQSAFVAPLSHCGNVPVLYVASVLNVLFTSPLLPPFREREREREKEKERESPFNCSSHCSVERERGREGERAVPLWKAALLPAAPPPGRPLGALAEPGRVPVFTGGMRLRRLSCVGVVGED